MEEKIDILLLDINKKFEKANMVSFGLFDNEVELEFSFILDPNHPILKMLDKKKIITIVSRVVISKTIFDNFIKNYISGRKFENVNIQKKI